MIDFTVAYDKLAQFETADDIAEYMESCGIKATRGQMRSCAVSQWMKEQTGTIIRTGVSSITTYDVNDSYVDSFMVNSVVADFIRNFDYGDYPQLVVEQ